MPISAYFKGDGVKVMRKLRKRYGFKKGTSMFYAIANKHPELKAEAQRRTRK